jgi:hypothetical protein
MAISIYPEHHCHTLISINYAFNFNLFCTFYINSVISERIKIYRLPVCTFFVSKCIFFVCNLVGCSWNNSSFSRNPAAAFDAWVRVLSDARISVIPTTTNVCFLIGSLHFGSFIPSAACITLTYLLHRGESFLRS